jgi:hypothetical protein
MSDWFKEFATYVATISVSTAILAWLGKAFVGALLKGGVEKFKADLKHEHDESLAAFKQNLQKDLNEFTANLQHEHDKALASYTQQLTAKAKSSERILTEIIAWANPIQDAAKSLHGRINNILNQEGYKALHPRYSNPDWPITYEYFTRSTAYVFGQYFCWINMLRLEMSFELFSTQADKVALFDKINAVSKALADYDPPIYPGSGHDSQIFRIQQQAMGELLSARRSGRRACRGPAFFDSKKNDPQYKAAFQPAFNLIDKLQPGEKRYQRLKATLTALKELVEHCDKLLKVPGTT